MPARVVVRDLWKRYGEVAAVRGVSFAVEPGEIFGLLGPNGAGKTSTIECLVGLREADAGEIEIDGLNARRDGRAVKERIGVALQTTSLQDKITVREALELFGGFYPQPVPPAELLARFGLAEKAEARFETLSGGQRQRLALALAFVNRPAVILLDEPTTGLDPQSRRELQTLILQLKKDGCTVLLSTHQLDEAAQLCDRVAIIDRGEIVATGAPHELMARSGGLQTITLVAKPALPSALLAGLAGVAAVEPAGTAIRLRSGDVTATLAALAALLREHGAELVDLQVRRASLEDVFLELTRPAGKAES
jgi:ABC-2 type transport system ATP-binding protein